MLPVDELPLAGADVVDLPPAGAEELPLAGADEFPLPCDLLSLAGGLSQSLTTRYTNRPNPSIPRMPIMAILIFDEVSCIIIPPFCGPM